MSRRRKVGWGDGSIGPTDGEDDGLDLSEYGLEDKAPQSYTHRCETPKCKKGVWRGPDLKLACPSCKKPCEAWDSADDDQHGLKPKARRKARKANAKKRSDTELCPKCRAGYHAEEDCKNPTWEEQVQQGEEVEEVAGRFAIDLSMECPVCRGLEDCGCEEEDRSFVRRTRFENDVKKVARCPRCAAPLSVVYLPRPGAAATPFRLAQFEAVYACSCCHTEALATAVLGVKR